MRKSLFLLTALLALLVCAPGYAQTRSVKGNVTFAADGEPVLGGYVIVEGTKPVIGTTTDIDGNFHLDNVPANAKFLIVSFVGCKDERVAIAPEVKVVLKDDSEMLEGVVVTGMQRWTAVSLRVRPPN